MKIYISADMEGLPCSTSWEDVDPSKPKYGEAQKIMTRFVAAACEAAFEAGAKEVVVKDAHWDGRNIFAEALPSRTQLIRGWSGHPFSMVEGIDSTFDALLMVGYHSGALTGGHPLAHTMSSKYFSAVSLNDKPIAEFHLHAFAAATVGVPTVLVSGDDDLAQAVKAFNEAIVTVPVCRGFGAATVSDTPELAIEKLRAGVKKALSSDFNRCAVPAPSSYKFSVSFSNHVDAYRASFYPGAKRESANTVYMEGKDFFDALRFLKFV